MKLKVLASGSKGNAYILESSTGSLLIEAGIKYSEILQGLNFNLGEVVGVICSHQHLDHSKALPELTKAGIDIYCNTDTIQALNLTGHRVNEIKPLEQFTIGDFKILPFPTEHDCPGLGFLIEYIPEGYRILFATDTFYLKYKFKNINTYMVECNYIKETLDENIAQGYIPEAHKPRLLQSHMSLENLRGFFKANDLRDCQNILLLHLSNINANGEQMIREVEEVTGIMPRIAEKGLEISLDLFPY